MKKVITYFFFLFLTGAMIMPLVPVSLAQDDDETRFSIGTWSQAQDWDPIAYGGLNLLDTYRWNALEPLILENKNFAGQIDQFVPTLATNWNIEYWPEETNSKGLVNRGGIKSIEFTLRQGVKFHDGSDWNASVAKWNIDRVMVGNGNLTGNGLKKWKHTFYFHALEFENYYTSSFNLTHFNNTMPEYGQYDGCQDESMRSYVPIIKNCTITENLQSGGKIKLYSNFWNAGLLVILVDILMISKVSYENYFDTPILGYGNNPSFPQPDVTSGYTSSGFPGHMIGTGAYRYITHDETASPAGGYMVKFEDYWNATGLEARGDFVVDYYDVVFFPYDTAGESLRNNAIVTGEIDFAFHTATGELNYDDVKNSTLVEWHDTTYDPNMNIISLNCIDDWYIPNSTLYTYGPETPGSVYDKSKRSGVPRAFRKALCYAFDYDTYISAAKKNRAIRLKYPVGASSTYYNDSLPYPYYDLDIARQALIDGGIAPSEAVNWTDSQWKSRAESNPLLVFEYAWDDAHEDVNNELWNALERIGCAANESLEWKFDPYCFSHIYNSMFFGTGTWPFYYAEGFNMKWPMPDADTAGYLQAMLGSREPWNLGFSYNSTADEWLDQMNFAGPETLQKLHDKYLTWCNTYQFPWLCISQDKNGYAINREFELDYYYDGAIQLPARIRYKTGGGFEIPGYSIYMMFFLMAAISIAIIFHIKQKRKIV